MVKRLGSKSVRTWFEVSGIDTVAPGRARGERGATAVATVIVALVIFLALLSWFAFTAFLPSATNPWQAMRGDSLG